MKANLTGLKGILFLIEDVFVFGSNQKEHYKKLRAALERLETATSYHVLFGYFQTREHRPSSIVLPSGLIILHSSFSGIIQEH